MAKTRLAPIVKHCDQLLRTKDITDWDGAVNGLQVENRGTVKRIAAAVDAYRASIENASFIYDSHLGLARALEKLGKTEEALAEYREAGRFAPGQPEIEAAIKRLEEGSG